MNQNDKENVEGDGEEDDENGDGNEGGNIVPDPVAPSEELNPDDQKVKLEQVAIKLLDKCPADDFQKFLDLEAAYEEEYASNDDYDFDALASFGEDALGSSYDEEESYVYDVLKKEYLRSSVSNLLVTLSNHKGEFTFGPDGVYKHDGSNFDGVKVTIPLNGKTYVAELTSSANVTRAVYDYSNLYKYQNSGYRDEMTGEWVDTPSDIWIVEEERCHIEIDVPETIDVVLYENGAKMASLNLKMTQSFSAAGLNPAVDNFNADIKIFLDNGYEIVLSKIAYDGAKQVCGGGVIFKKDGEALVSAAVAGKAEIANSVHRDEGRDYRDYMSEYTTVEVKKARDFTVVMDIIGEIQIKGTCSDGKAAADSYDAYFDAVSHYDDNGNSRTPDEDAAKRHLSNLNAKLDLGVYYDLGTNRQAKVILDMYKRYSDWDPSEIRYDIRPLVVFNDGSSYSMEEYFTEAAFETLIERFEEISEDYNDLFGDFGFVKEEMPHPVEDFEHEIKPEEPYNP